jgi:sec-independent protein translocase protein TatB
MNLSPEKMFLVGLVALVVLGPNRLPAAARTAGRMLAEFRRTSTNLQRELADTIVAPRDSLNGMVRDVGLTDLRSTITAAPSTVRGVVTDLIDGGAVQCSPPEPVDTPIGPDDPSLN